MCNDRNHEQYVEKKKKTMMFQNKVRTVSEVELRQQNLNEGKGERNNK